MEIDNHVKEFAKLSSACSFDTETHGISIINMHELTKTRKYGSRKTGLSKGAAELNENVDKMINCGDSSFGGAMYRCT